MPSDPAKKPWPRPPLRNYVLALFVALAWVFVVAAPAHGQALPPTLAGEELSAIESGFTNTGTVNIGAACTGTAGETYSLFYSASGPAIGPYPGMFSESGTVTAQSV